MKRTFDPRSRAIVAILSCTFGAGLMLGLVLPLFSIAMETQGASALLIGIAAGVQAAGSIVSGRLVTRLARHIGVLPTIITGLALSAATLVAYPLADDPILWLALRFLAGFGLSLHWVLSETWINTLADDATRGRLIGVYAAIWGGGIAAGPQILLVVGTDGWPPYLIGALILAAMAIPVLLARRTAPNLQEGEDVSGALLPIVAIAPLGLIAAVACGLLESIMFSLFPVYVLGIGRTLLDTSILLTAFGMGNLVLQALIGWFNDRIGWWTVLISVTAIGTLVIAVTPFLTPWLWALACATFLWGGLSGGFYTLGLVRIGQRFKGAMLSTANAAFIVAYTVGTLTGPTITGLAMDTVGVIGFVLISGTISSVCLVTFLSAYRRRRLQASA